MEPLSLLLAAGPKSRVSPFPSAGHAAASWDGHGLLIVGGEDIDDIVPFAWLADRSHDRIGIVESAC